MAIYSLHMSSVNRGSGSNACATLSYITAERVHCDRTNQNFSYGRDERVLAVETCLPTHAPSEFVDNPEAIFNAVENIEKTDKACPAKKIVVAIPYEIKSLENQQELIREFCGQLTKMGYACTFAIHCDQKGNNPHAHILVANRRINENGEFEKVKCKKQYVLDDNGERIPIIDPDTGVQKVDGRNRKQWKRENVKVNPLTEKSTLLALRENWETLCNKRLDPSQHITAKSHEARGLITEPTIHEGYAAREIERRGGFSELCEINRQIVKYNRFVTALQVCEKQLSSLKSLLLKNKSKKKHHRHIDTGTRAYLQRQQAAVKKHTSPTPVTTPPTATQAVTPQPVAKTEPPKQVEPAQQPTAPPSPPQTQPPKKRVKPKRESPSEHIARMTQRAADHNASLNPQFNNQNHQRRH